MYMPSAVTAPAQAEPAQPAAPKAGPQVPAEAGAATKTQIFPEHREALRSQGYVQLAPSCSGRTVTHLDVGGRRVQVKWLSGVAPAARVEALLALAVPFVTAVARRLASGMPTWVRSRPACGPTTLPELWPCNPA